MKKKPSLGGMIAKLAFGAVFIVIGIAPDPEFEAGARGMAIIIGVALIAWGILKYFGWYRQHKQIMMELDREEKEIASLKEAVRNKPRKCPHCGGTTRGNVCDYCGSALDYVN